MAHIDAHLHVFARPSARFPRQATPLAPAEREEPVEKLLEQMQAHAIDQAMLVQLGGTALEEHAYLQHCLSTYPDRFQGIGLIPPDCPEPEAHMDALAAKGGIVGFRLGTLGGPADPFAPIDVKQFSSYRIWRHAAQRDYVLWLYLQAGDAHLAAHIIDAFPQVRVVFNHLGICPGRGQFSIDQWGRPQVATAPYNPAFHTTWRLARYENVAVLLSCQYAFSKEDFPHRDLAGWHQSLLGAFGAGRLMWATDAPWIYQQPGYGPLTTIIDELLPGISAQEKAAIMGGTAGEFLRFANR
ncbi:MAG: amidohydrolase family protein [Candidatus Latescibacteria bacterium]|nr:amidohydrolase family protein [Candidatus Latescibacterota bacterium]